MAHKMDVKLSDIEQPYWNIPENVPVDVVVLPSITLECDEDFKRVPGLVHKEERHLFTTLFLRNPELQLIYITSYPLDPAVIQYYLSLLPPDHAIPFNPESITERKIPIEGSEASIIEFIPKRFYNVCLHDLDEIALADKLRKKYVVMESVKSLLRNLETSYMLCYRTSDVEERISKDLGLNLIASPSRLDHFGSKSGSREIFAESGIPFMPGTPLVHSVKDLASAVRDLIISEWKAKRDVHKIVIKLDDFSAGGGNAVLDMSPILKNKDACPSVEAIEKHFDNLEPPYSDQTAADFLKFVPEIGVIAEKWAEVSKGGRLTSPSVQCMISAKGEITVISSHGQVLEGHEYSGGCFPASTDNHKKLYAYAEQVGKVLRDKGVRGHFGIDFVELCEPRECGGSVDGDDACDSNNWQAFGIEINLRFTGTTGPYLVLRLLAPGEYDKAAGTYTAKTGKPKFYATTEGMKDNNLKGVTPRNLLDLTQKYKQLSWNRDTQTGTLFHMLGGIDKFGKVGVTCIAESADGAQQQLEEVREVFSKLHHDNKKNGIATSVKSSNKDVTMTVTKDSMLLGNKEGASDSLIQLQTGMPQSSGLVMIAPPLQTAV